MKRDLSAERTQTLGIDPDAMKCGVCVISGDQIVRLESVQPAELILRIYNGDYDHCRVVVEDVTAIDTIYARNRTGKNAIDLKIAQGVGKVKGVCMVLFDALESAGIEAVKVRPGVVDKRVEKDADYFNRLSGWRGRSNADTRAAWCIAMGGRAQARLPLTGAA